MNRFEIRNLLLMIVYSNYVNLMGKFYN